MATAQDLQRQKALQEREDAARREKERVAKEIARKDRDAIDQEITRLQQRKTQLNAQINSPTP